MAKAIEECIKKCKACDKKTRHIRETTKTGFVMAIIHILLIIGTCGIWLLLLIINSLLNTKIGGWTCQECGK